VSSLAGLVAALVVAAAPPHTVRPQMVFADLSFRQTPIKVLPASKRRTCTLRRKNAPTAERAIEPVSCEQPPRTETILTVAGGLFGRGR
jgi:hypothetical protein